VTRAGCSWGTTSNNKVSDGNSGAASKNYSRAEGFKCVFVQVKKTKGQPANCHQKFQEGTIRWATRVNKQHTGV